MEPESPILPTFSVPLPKDISIPFKGNHHFEDDATLQDELPPMGDVGEPQRSTSPVMFGRRKPKILFNSNDNDDGFFPKENVSNSQELLRPRFSSFARHNSSNSLLPDNLPPRQRSSCQSLRRAATSGSLSASTDFVSTLLPRHKYNVDNNMIKTITPETAVEAFNGAFSHLFETVVVIDTRYAYEFNGGHIKGAVNLMDLSSISSLLIPDVNDIPVQSPTIVIFHCEHSERRSVTLIKQFRDKDRNLSTYPNLMYPDVYLCSGGYNAFFSKFPYLCEPQHYIKENDPQFSSERKNSMQRANSLSKIDLNSSQQLRRSRSGSLRQSDDKPLSNSCSFSPPERSNSPPNSKRSINVRSSLDGSLRSGRSTMRRGFSSGFLRTSLNADDDTGDDHGIRRLTTRSSFGGSPTQGNPFVSPPRKFSLGCDTALSPDLVSPPKPASLFQSPTSPGLTLSPDASPQQAHNEFLLTPLAGNPTSVFSVAPPKPQQFSMNASLFMGDFNGTVADNDDVLQQLLSDDDDVAF